MYSQCVAGLKTTVAAAHSGLTVLDYEPTSIQQTPAIYFLLDTFKRVEAGQVVTMTYRIRARLCIPWVDNQAAERQIEPYVNSIPACILASPRLGFLTAGYAWVDEGESGFRDIAGTTMRCVDFFVNVLEKGTADTGF